MAALAPALGENGVLEELRLASSGLSVVGVRAVCDVVRSSAVSVVQVLDLGGNSGLGVGAAEALADALEAGWRVEELMLGLTGLG